MIQYLFTTTEILKGINMSTQSRTEIKINLSFTFEDVGMCYSFKGYDDQTFTAKNANEAREQYLEFNCEDFDEDGVSYDDPKLKLSAGSFVPYGYQLKPIWNKRPNSISTRGYEPKWITDWIDRNEGIRTREDGFILVEGAESYEEACEMLQAEIFKELMY